MWLSPPQDGKTSIHETMAVQVGWDLCCPGKQALPSRKHRAWGSGKSCTGDILNSKHRNYILWQLVVTLYFLVLWSDFSHGLVRLAKLYGLFFFFFFLPQLASTEPDTQLGVTGLWLGMEPEAGFRASCLSWPVSSNPDCITNGFLFAKGFPIFSFVSLPHSHSLGGQRITLMLLSQSNWRTGREGRLVLLEGHPGGKHLADQGLA